MIEHLNKYYLEGSETRVRLELWLVKKQHSLVLARARGCLVISVVWTTFTFLFFFMNDSRVA